MSATIKLKPDALYLGDNGRCFCTKHAGASALYSGRDLSGQRVHEVTVEDRLEAAKSGWLIRCEECPR